MYKLCDSSLFVCYHKMYSNFTVDASRAGRGNLNLTITASGRDVKYNLRELTSGVYEVTYIPHTDHPHKIDVYYNGHQAPGIIIMHFCCDLCLDRNLDLFHDVVKVIKE